MATPEKAMTEFDGQDRRDPSGRNSYRRSIYSVPVTVTVSIGQKRLSVQEILELQPDSVIALSSKVDDPVDLFIDDKLIAKGELVETDDGQIAVKIVEIIEKAIEPE
ncbi:putative flagellar motor switch protein FliN [Hyphomonas hirschiana VP5]|nr:MULTISPECIES: FliM/FliN family flagellar motor C-terminal domain-containing protein [Hyphomonas]KCZ95403.1 putative flagellar motor switch protein FliN [Hyphomonas hirschiana VP5]